MDAPKERLDYLFMRYVNRTATPQEMHELYSLVAESTDDEHLAALLQEVWYDSREDLPLFSPDQSEKLLHAILPAEQKPLILAKHSVSFSLVMKIAAAIILMLAGFFYFHQQNLAPVIKTVKHIPKHDILPGGNRATLTLVDGRTITLDRRSNGVLTEHEGLRITKTASGQLLCNLVGISPKTETAKNVITTPKGGQYQIMLADGTRVWLNAASSLRFPVAFNEQSRVVELTGEAYFEVAKNPAKPFIVKTANNAIKVFGTHFNVMAYEDEPLAKTTLLEGSVSVSSGNNAAMIKPGEQAISNADGKISVHQHVNQKVVMAWKNGNFSFDDTNIQDVMRQVARWYDISVVYEGRIPSKKLTGTLSRNVNASTLLTMLSYTGINFRIEEQKIIVTD